MAGATGAIIFVLLAVALGSSLFAVSKFRENRRLRQEIIELEMETDNRTVDKDNDDNKQ